MSQASVIFTFEDNRLTQHLPRQAVMRNPPSTAANLDWQAYPHIFKQISKQTCVRTYLSLRLLNREVKEQIDGGFGRFIFSDIQIDPDERAGDVPTMPVYIVQVHDGSGYLVAAHRSQTIPHPPRYRLDKWGSTIFSVTNLEAMSRMCAFLGMMRYNSPQRHHVQHELIGDCLRDHTIVQDMLSRLHVFTDLHCPLVVRPDKNGAISQRLDEFRKTLIFVENWKARRGRAVIGTGLSTVTFQIDGYERGRLCSTSLSYPCHLHLDFKNWSSANTMRAKMDNTYKDGGYEDHANITPHDAIDLVSRPLLARRPFTISNLSLEAMAWLDGWHLVEARQTSELPWDHFIDKLCDRLRAHKLDYIYIEEVVNMRLPGGTFTGTWRPWICHSVTHPPSSICTQPAVISVRRALENRSCYLGMLEVVRWIRIEDKKRVWGRASMVMGEY